MVRHWKECSNSRATFFFCFEMQNESFLPTRGDNLPRFFFKRLNRAWMESRWHLRLEEKLFSLLIFYELLYRIEGRYSFCSNSTLRLSLALCKLKARIIARGCLFPCPVRIVTHQRADEMAMNVTFSEYIVEFKWSWTFASILLSIYRRKYKLQ